MHTVSKTKRDPKANKINIKTDNKMKKNYQTPRTTVVELSMQHIMAGSQVTTIGGNGGLTIATQQQNSTYSGGVRSRSSNGWDDDEE